MTLCTHVYIHDEIDPMLVFAKCRDLLGCDRKITSRLSFGWEDDEHWTAHNDIGQGLDALLWMDFRPGRSLRSPREAAEHGKYCDSNCDGSSHSPPCWVDVSFDTAYGYTKDEEGCGHLHARLVAELGAWVDSLRKCGARSGPPGKASWSWKNEFTGDVHEGPDLLYELVDESEEARQWFARVVLPAIEARHG